MKSKVVIKFKLFTSEQTVLKKNQIFTVSTLTREFHLKKLEMAV